MKSVALAGRCCHQSASFRHRNRYSTEIGQFTSWSCCNKCLFLTRCGARHLACLYTYAVDKPTGEKEDATTNHILRTTVCREKALITTTSRGKLVFHDQTHVAMTKNVRVGGDTDLPEQHFLLTKENTVVQTNLHCLCFGCTGIISEAKQKWNCVHFAGL